MIVNPVQGALPGGGTSPAVSGMAGAVGGMPGGMDPMQLMMAMGQVQMPDQRQPGMQTTFPDAPRSVSPAFAQLILQALQQNQPMQTGLGAMLSGR